MPNFDGWVRLHPGQAFGLVKWCNRGVDPVSELRLKKKNKMLLGEGHFNRASLMLAVGISIAKVLPMLSSCCR